MDGYMFLVLKTRYYLYKVSVIDSKIANTLITYFIPDDERKNLSRLCNRKKKIVQQKMMTLKSVSFVRPVEEKNFSKYN